MSGTYGFGIIVRLAPEATGTERDELLLSFARLGLCKRFHEVIGDRVLRVECGAKARLDWLGPAEAEPILAAARALGVDPASLVSASDDRMMLLSHFGDVLVPGQEAHQPHEDDDAAELEMEDTPLDGLRVGSVSYALAELGEQKGAAAGGDAGEPDEVDAGSEAAQAERSAALDEELAAEAEFERGLVAALEVCAAQQLVLTWSPAAHEDEADGASDEAAPSGSDDEA